MITQLRYTKLFQNYFEPNGFVKCQQNAMLLIAGDSCVHHAVLNGESLYRQHIPTFYKVEENGEENKTRKT